MASQASGLVALGRDQDVDRARHQGRKAQRLTTRPATAADIAKYYPDIGASFRAWVAELDGHPAGIIGLALTRPTACAFSAFDEELRPRLKCMTVLRLIRKLKQMIEARGLPVMAIAEGHEPTAPDILRRLGFAYIGEHEGDSVFEWRA